MDSNLLLYLAVVMGAMYATFAYEDHNKTELQKVCLASHSVEECSKLNK